MMLYIEDRADETTAFKDLEEWFRRENENNRIKRELREINGYSDIAYHCRSSHSFGK